MFPDCFYSDNSLRESDQIYNDFIDFTCVAARVRMFVILKGLKKQFQNAGNLTR